MFCFLAESGSDLREPEAPRGWWWARKKKWKLPNSMDLARFLSTCRGFGDPELKQPDPIITATPEVRAFRRVLAASASSKASRNLAALQYSFHLPRGGWHTAGQNSS